MMRIPVVLTTLLMCGGTVSRLASQKPQEGQTIIDFAMKQSKDQKKPIWLIFDASW